METAILLLIGLVLLGLAARYFALLLLIGKARFRVDHPLGFRAAELSASEESWDAGHRAARPLLVVTVAIAALDAFATVGMLRDMGTLSAVFVGALQVLVVIGLARLARSEAIRKVRGHTSGS